jgi:hypothetical protein
MRIRQRLVLMASAACGLLVVAVVGGSSAPLADNGVIHAEKHVQATDGVIHSQKHVLADDGVIHMNKQVRAD